MNSCTITTGPDSEEMLAFPYFKLMFSGTYVLSWCWVLAVTSGVNFFFYLLYCYKTFLTYFTFPVIKIHDFSNFLNHFPGSQPSWNYFWDIFLLVLHCFLSYFYAWDFFFFFWNSDSYFPKRFYFFEILNIENALQLIIWICFPVNRNCFTRMYLGTFLLQLDMESYYSKISSVSRITHSGLLLILCRTVSL